MSPAARGGARDMKPATTTSRIKAGVTSDTRQVTSARSADRFQGLPGLSQVYPDRRLFPAKNWLLASDFPENQPSQRIGAASTKDWR